MNPSIKLKKNLKKQELIAIFLEAKENMAVEVATLAASSDEVTALVVESEDSEV